MANSFARAVPSWPTGWRQRVTRNGSRSRLRHPPPWRQSNGNRHPADRRRRQLQGEVRLLRSRKVRLQGQARAEPRGRQRDLVDEERAGVDDEIPAARAYDLGQEGNADMGCRPLHYRLPEHLLLLEIDGEA